MIRLNGPVWRVKRSGSRTEPCEAPKERISFFERQWSSLTNWSRSKRWELSQEIPTLPKPCHFSSLWRRILWSIVSKAADRSSKVRAVTWPLSVAVRMSLLNLKNDSFCRVELFVGRLKTVTLVGSFKEGADLRSCNPFNKFGSKLRFDTGR